MTSVVYFLPLLLSLATAAPTTLAPTPEPPNGIRQCARSECPVYTELQDYGSDLYKRRIEPGLWATKVSPTCNRSEAISDEVYMALHNYFENNNISRTTPIVLEDNKNKARSNLCPDQSDQFPCCSRIFSLAFFIPSASQDSAPQPTPESGVYLVNASDPRDFYVSVFTGRATVVQVTREYNELLTYLNRRRLPYNEDDLAIASYDAPWRPQPHRSEVWIAVESGHRRGGGRPRGDGDDDNSRGRGDNGNNSGDRDGNSSRERRSIHLEANIDLLPY